MQKFIILLPKLVQLANIACMILLIIFVALQNKSAGLSGVFGGSGSIAQTRRGAEKWLFFTTVITGFIFVTLSIVQLFLK